MRFGFHILRIFALFPLLSLASLGAGEANDASMERFEFVSQVPERAMIEFRSDIRPSARVYSSVAVAGARYRLDTIESHGERTESDFPIVSALVYTTRKSPWSDPQRFREARLLGREVYAEMVSKKFGEGQRLSVSSGVMRSDIIYSSSAISRAEMTSIPVEAQIALNEGVSAIFRAEASDTVIFKDGESPTDIRETIAQVGFEAQLGRGIRARALTGARELKSDDFESGSNLEFDASLVWDASESSSLILEYSKSASPIVILYDGARPDTLRLAGEFVIGSEWSAQFGVTESWAKFGDSVEESLFGSELSITYSPTESVHFSGGYEFRSGSLTSLNEEEADTIMRLSAEVSY